MRALVLLRGVLLLIVGGTIRAQDFAVVSDGPNSWSHTVTGSVSVEPQGQLEVEARGRIIVRGGAVDRIVYKLVQRVHAANEAAARDLFGSGVLRPAVVGHVTRIDVHQNSSPNVGNELEITVPRNLTAVTVGSQFGGGIEAYDLDGRVNALTPFGDIRLDRIGGAVLAKAGSGNLFFGRVGGIEECFTGAGTIFVEHALGGVKSCRTGAGDLVVKQAGAPGVFLENEGGNISVERAAGPVEAHAISGMIQIGQAGGPVTADTRGGSIQVGAAPGVRAESAQGTVRVRGLSGPMDVSTGLGNILAELMPGAKLRDSTLAAGSGDITVFIPSNFPVSVMVLNNRGGYPQLMSDFREVRAMTLPFARSPVVAQGAINGGGPVLRINAGTGVVYLRKSK